MPRVHHVQSARTDHDECEVKKGESYYWWKIKTGPASGVKRCSKTEPLQSQLTNSPFSQSVYSIIEDINSVSSVENSEELRSLVEGWVSDIQSIADECEESYNNMPENLRDTSETGQTLQDRQANMEEWARELESVDLDDESALEEIQQIGSSYA